MNLDRLCPVLDTDAIQTRHVAVTGALSTFRDLLKVRRSLRKSKDS